MDSFEDNEAAFVQVARAVYAAVVRNAGHPAPRHPVQLKEVLASALLSQDFFVEICNSKHFARPELAPVFALNLAEVTLTSRWAQVTKDNQPLGGS